MDMSAISRFVNESAMSDPEFARAMRYCTGQLRIDVGDESAAWTFEDGALIGESTEPLEKAEIRISGSQEHFDRMLEAYPTPFYQCLQTTSIKHGLILNNTSTFYAYLPALNRLVALLRASNNSGKVAA